MPPPTSIAAQFSVAPNVKSQSPRVENMQANPVRRNAELGHDTLVRRLVQILVKLNQGEKLNPAALAEEFGVTLRTIQRDLNVRFAYLPLEKIDGLYQLDSVFLGKLSTLDVERFASLAGIRGLFPSLSEDFLRDIFDSSIHSALLVKGHDYEDLQGKEQGFRDLERAIVSRLRVSFTYKGTEVTQAQPKTYVEIEPHKLINHKGIWYLAATDGDKLKTFSFSRVERLHVSESAFEPDPEIERALRDDDSIWLGPQRTDVVLNIAPKVAGYFKRRKLIANQVIDKELKDGSLIISTSVAHVNQVLSIVRYWIPHIVIVSPDHLQSALELELKNYVNRSRGVE